MRWARRVQTTVGTDKHGKVFTVRRLCVRCRDGDLSARFNEDQVLAQCSFYLKRYIFTLHYLLPTQESKN